MANESLPKKQKRSQIIFKTLLQNHPTLSTFLTHKNPFELLIAVILSAQCTDERVNLTTPALFEDFPTPQKLALAKESDVMELIKSINYYKTKAKNIIKTSQNLVKKFHGSVPDTLEELISLPGVGRKTANVLLGQAFGKPGITVDTHVKRVSTRLGFTRQIDATKIEYDLQKVWKQTIWTDLSTHLIYHGRQRCKPKHPICNDCTINKHCPSKTT
ncbi:MAG: endonuclease III [Actinobacteria bacterium]|nr:endonuclease III [Actinomycetota bacterium]|tara:strand:- start:27 stop:674 length:648 start_codon:yes stop_codon:yes gene_type:complete